MLSPETLRGGHLSICQACGAWSSLKISTSILFYKVNPLWIKIDSLSRIIFRCTIRFERKLFFYKKKGGGVLITMQWRSQREGVSLKSGRTKIWGTTKGREKRTEESGMISDEVGDNW